MEKQIALPESLYERLAAHARGFETPAEVIARLLDAVESADGLRDGQSPQSRIGPATPTGSAPHAVLAPAKLKIDLYPSDIAVFKQALLDRRVAWVLLHKNDGTRELRQWNAQRFTDQSDVIGNLRSGYLRGWREKGIVHAEVAIDRHDLNVS